MTEPSRTPDKATTAEITRMLSEVLVEIRSTMSEIRTLYDSHNKRLERLENEIWGNGRAGLAVQVRAILWIAMGCLGFVTLILGHLVYEWVGRL
ncbi:MAG: hypothetical protein ACUVWX_14135 [Kiritimatiellia bacterium]